MGDIRRRVARVLLGAVVVCIGVLGVVAPASATAEDCGGGQLQPLQAAADPTIVVGVRITEVGLACDGQPVGVQFLGNGAGDPALPSSELARAYSDEDPCTGAEQPDGVLRGGTVEVRLCEGSATAGHVDGRQLTELRLITTADAPAGSDDPDPAPDGPDPAPDAPDPALDPAPDPAPDQPAGEDLPMTGADVLRAALLGAVLLATGVVLTRLARSRRHWVR